MADYFTTLKGGEQLQERLNVDASQYADFQYFIKGDISGIQEFIFNVQSEGAAKTLKARSFFIQILSRVCIKHFEEKLEDNCKVFYDGGGTFYLFSKIDPEVAIRDIRKVIDDYCGKEEFYVILNSLDLQDPKFPSNYINDFSKIWTHINHESNEAKLTKFAGELKAFAPYPSIFSKENYDKLRNWKEFATYIVDRKGTDVPNRGILVGENKPKKEKIFEVKKENIQVFDRTVRIGDTEEVRDKFSGSIINKLPVWHDDVYQKYYHLILEENKLRAKKGDENDKIRLGQIIDFHMMGLMAKQRTGTDKLAVLKLDIDNLGALFRGLNGLAELEKTSKAMEWFFDKFLCQLWQNGTFKYQEPYEAQGETRYKLLPESYRDNVYVVFAGGDDCFVVGAWDAIFEFAKDLHQAFDDFQAALTGSVAALKTNLTPEKGHFYEKITLSASLTVVGSKFPVVRFTGMAEEALEAVKTHFKIDGKPIKNAISVFGHVLRWEDFYKAYDNAKSLRDLVTERGESRALLERLQQSTTTYARLFDHAGEGNLRAPQVARLYYYLRNVKNKKENLDFIEEQIITPYSRGLLRAYQEAHNPNYKFDINKPAQSWLTIPVAARWAELLTRK